MCLEKIVIRENHINNGSSQGPLFRGRWARATVRQILESDKNFGSSKVSRERVCCPPPMREIMWVVWNSYRCYGLFDCFSLHFLYFVLVITTKWGKSRFVCQSFSHAMSFFRFCFFQYQFLVSFQYHFHFISFIIIIFISFIIIIIIFISFISFISFLSNVSVAAHF